MSINRRGVLVLLCLLLIITYLDRVCIAIAGPRMQDTLHIGPVGWGWVTGMFTLAYALFEIPSGALGDRIGPRRVLTRIVLWWSAFTTFTGLVSGFYPLLFLRFAFGMGEAGAYPNTSIAIARWFTAERRTTAWGMGLMSGQIGGFLAPLLVVPVQMRYGWRASFFAFGFLGLLWAAAWWRWFRDTPDGSTLPPPERHQLPWRVGIRSANLWYVMAMAGAYGYTLYFYQSWFHTYLIKGRGFSEAGLLLSSLPFAVAAVCNFSGGFLGDRLIRRVGLRWGRRGPGVIGLSLAAAAVAAAAFTTDRYAVVILLSFALGGISIQQPGVLGVCLDIGGKYAGAVTGAMNTATFLCSFLSSLAYGYLVQTYHNYDAPFVPMAILLAVSALIWLKIEPDVPVAPDALAAPSRS